MNRRIDWPVPPELLVAALNKTWELLFAREQEVEGYRAPGIDNWGEYESHVCREQLPQVYWDIETDKIRKLCGTIRRRPKDYGYTAPRQEMGRAKGKVPDGYQKYLESEVWRFLRDTLLWPFWEKVFGKRVCALCTRTTNLEMHHRHYNMELGFEEPGDCIPLCRICHGKVHKET